MKYCSGCGQLVPEPKHRCDPERVDRWLSFATEHKAENVPGMIPDHVLEKILQGRIY